MRRLYVSLLLQMHRVSHSVKYSLRIIWIDFYVYTKWIYHHHSATILNILILKRPCSIPIQSRPEWLKHYVVKDKSVYRAVVTLRSNGEETSNNISNLWNVKRTRHMWHPCTSERPVSAERIDLHNNEGTSWRLSRSTVASPQVNNSLQFKDPLSVVRREVFSTTKPKIIDLHISATTR